VTIAWGTDGRYCQKFEPKFDNNDINWKCINTVRCLTADMVQKANSGHPGAPMGCAPMAHVLWNKVMRYSPANPKWVR